MGRSTSGILAYGYNLGGDEEWALEGLGEYGELPELPWYNEDDDDFQGDAETHLLAQIAGFTETWSRDNEGYRDREREAKVRLGVQFDTHGSGEYPMFLMATKVITVHGGSVKDVDMAALAVEPEVHGWDEKLRTALETLGLRPQQEKPQWLLCSYWG